MEDFRPFLAQIISGSFAYVVMTVIQFIMAFTLLILPLIVTVVCPNNTREEVSDYILNPENSFISVGSLVCVLGHSLICRYNHL